MLSPPATEVAEGNVSEASVSHSIHRGGGCTGAVWHLPHTVSKRALRILLERFLVTVRNEVATR